MQVDFQRTLRSLAQERRRTRVGCILITALTSLTAAWGIWLFEARVNLYELSSTARIETGQRSHPVETVLPGRIARIAVRLGQPVKSGDVIVEIDSTTLVGQIDGANIELAALASQIETRQSEAVLTERLIAERNSQGEVAIAQAMNRRDQADEAAQHSAYLADQSQVLLSKGATTNNGFLQARRNADQGRGEFRAARLEVDRLRWQSAMDQRELRVRIADLRDRTAALQAAIARRKAELETLRRQLDDHKVRAPADGIVGELADIRIGSVIQAGERLATVLPGGDVHVVAQFVPAGALGRVAPGQTARVRLNGFPWQQYGSLAGTVVSVAGEVRDGTIRVELALSRENPSTIPLQHGQPGEVEIEVGSASPFDLLVRNTGRLIRSGEPTGTPALVARTVRNGSAS